MTLHQGIIYICRFREKDDDDGDYKWNAMEHFSFWRG